MKELRQKSTELKETLRSSLSPRHHAMLYAYIVRSCRRLPYDDVEQVIEKITVEYGRRRGRRMAARAARDKMPLTALNYEAYQEWQALPVVVAILIAPNVLHLLFPEAQGLDIASIAGAMQPMGANSLAPVLYATIGIALAAFLCAYACHRFVRKTK